MKKKGPGGNQKKKKKKKKGQCTICTKHVELDVLHRTIVFQTQFSWFFVF